MSMKYSLECDNCGYQTIEWRDLTLLRKLATDAGWWIDGENCACAWCYSSGLKRKKVSTETAMVVRSKQ